MGKIGVGIIGCGTIANSAHIPAYLKNDDAEILYFCDIRPERAAAAVEQYGVGRAVADYRQVLADPAVAAVSVCVPNNMHAPISIDALEAGKDVLCEKPVARTYDEALGMLEAKKKTGRLLAIGVVNRYNFSVNQIRDIIAGGELGEVYQVYVSFRSHRSIPGLGGDFTRRAVAGGGALIDWGVHFLDIVMYCTGDPAPLTVTGEVFGKLGADMRGYTYTSMWAGPPNYDGVYDVEDSVTGLIRTTGPVITLNGAWAQNIGEQEMFIDFMGTRAGIRLQYGAGFKLYSSRGGMLSETSFTFPQHNHFEAEINAFVNSVATGAKLPSDIETALKTARMMQAVYDSSAAHAEIKLD